MTNPSEICDLLSKLKGSIPSTLADSGSLPSEEDILALQELSAEGWQTALVDKFAAQIADSSLTTAELAMSLDHDAFTRDFVQAQNSSRRSRAEFLLQLNRQRMADGSEDSHLKKQWWQIGTRSDAPTEEEVIDARQ